jgi:hypothetical protein
MSGTTVVRSASTRIVMSSYFLFVLLLLLTLLNNKVQSVRIIAYVLVIVCAIGLFRAQRCGYVAIDSHQLVVRTLLRTRTFQLSEIKSIEPITIMQVTKHVIPVLTLSDGHRYKLSEFFMQKRMYQRVVENNKVTNLIQVVSTELAKT